MFQDEAGFGRINKPKYGKGCRKSVRASEGSQRKGCKASSQGWWYALTAERGCKNSGNRFFRCSKYKNSRREMGCTQHYIREDVLYKLVLKQLQAFFSYLRQFERVFVKRQMALSAAEQERELICKKKGSEKGSGS